eukprot:m.127890 g.127890  ORF g.127890 m.127890 type:complete len:66 (-) comp14553_c0_seq11:1093-1290(-)
MVLYAKQLVMLLPPTFVLHVNRRLQSGLRRGIVNYQKYTGMDDQDAVRNVLKGNTTSALPGLSFD